MTRSDRPVALRAWHADAAWQWWCTAMRQWLPHRWRARWEHAPDQVLLQARQGQLTVALQQDGHCRALATLALPASQSQLLAVLPAAARGLPRVWLLEPAQVLRRALRLPAAAAAKLDAVLGFEIDRQTPFAPDQVHHATRLLGEAGAGQIDAELVVVPRRQLQDLLAAAGEPATALAGVDVGDIERGGWGINLLPGPQRVVPRSRHARLALALLLLAAVLAAAGGARSLDNRRQAVEALRQQVAALAPQAREVARQRQQVQAMVDGASFFARRRTQRPDRSAVWEELSARLPDGTWVERLSMEGDQLQLIGLSDQASALVGRLEGSTLWERPSLTGVLQAEPGQRSERFTLAASLRSVPSNDADTGGADADHTSH